MNNKIILPTKLLLALAATTLLGTTAVAADDIDKASATRQAAIVLARASVALQKEHLDAENMETADSALSQALENLALDNQSELELRISDHTFTGSDTGK